MQSLLYILIILILRTRTHKWTSWLSGDFFIQNGVEANYWVGAMHYLRSCTKMFYGGDASEIGAPPPVVKLNGYGDFVFNDVPL